MTPLGRTCFPPFSFMGFIAWLMPWLPSKCIKAPENISEYVQPAATDDQTVESLSVMNNDLRYLTRAEAEQIINQFKKIPHSSNRLLFWTGIPKSWVQRWAGEHDLLTLTSAMGPLMDVTDPRCLKWTKKQKQWSKYVKGASGIFARYACGHGIVRVLTLPPSWSGSLRPKSSYLTIEEPVLKGVSGCFCAVQINTVHLLESSRALEYQSWPQNRISEVMKCKGDDTFKFRLPPRILKAVKAAGQNLRSSLTASTTSKPANAISILHGPDQRSGFLAAKKQQESSERQDTSGASKKCGMQQTLAQTGKGSTEAHAGEEKSDKPRCNQQPDNKQAKSKQTPQIKDQQKQSGKQQPSSKHPTGKKNELKSEQRPGSKQAKSTRTPQSSEQKPQIKAQANKRQPHGEQQATAKQPQIHIQAQTKEQQGSRIYPVTLIRSSSLKQKNLAGEGAKQGEVAIKNSREAKKKCNQ